MEKNFDSRLRRLWANLKVKFSLAMGHLMYYEQPKGAVTRLAGSAFDRFFDGDEFVKTTFWNRSDYTVGNSIPPMSIRWGDETLEKLNAVTTKEFFQVRKEGTIFVRLIDAGMKQSELNGKCRKKPYCSYVNEVTNWLQTAKRNNPSCVIVKTIQLLGDMNSATFIADLVAAEAKV